MQHKILLHIILIFSIASIMSFPTATQAEYSEFQGKASMSGLPTVLVKDDIEKFALEKVRLIGRYTQINVNKRPGQTPAYTGHIALTLQDNTRVLLYPVWHVEAKRPQSEISRFENQTVEVVGKIFLRSPSSRNNAANLLLSCLTKVESIELVNN